MEAPSWKAAAACRGRDHRLFFPVASTDATLDYGPALAICAPCPVTEACLSFALANHELDGVWGGTTPAQRPKLGRYRCKVCGVTLPRTARGGAPRQICDDVECRRARKAEHSRASRARRAG